ncbi:MAG: LLM class F420-dependent oxidoreductase [Alphaproteobacteria bacterium]|nr:LLM class F420-dependent oxidoreductase [Alphaproteobacteria bacterium]
MKFGLRYCNTGKYTDTARAMELVQAGEAAGFESAWTVEHTIIPEGYESSYPYSDSGKMPGIDAATDLPDPLVWMAYMASVTSKIKLATGILILSQHSPVVCAKQVATLDAMSGGRVLLGIGVGWLREEFDIIGANFEERGPRCDDYMQAMRALWQMERPAYDGRFVKFDGAYCRPKPANGTVPLIVGGHSKAAARRAGRLGDGFFPARGNPKELFQLARDTAREHGRDPDAIEFTASLPDNLDDIPALAAMGVKRLLVPVTGAAGLANRIRGPEDLKQWSDTIQKYADL